MAAVAPTNNIRNWEAKLNLKFEYKNDRTILTNRRHHGPLLVQKPFYPEQPDCCHVYLIHPPAGIVGGDSLTIEASIGEYAHGLITTPAATKFYRSNGFLSSQTQIFNLAPNAILEWLPQETIYFNSANAESKTRINANIDSNLIAWEIQCLGRPTNKEDFLDGHCMQKLEIWVDNKPLFLECNRLTGNSNILNSAWGLRSNKSIGTLVTTDNKQNSLLEIVKEHASSFTTITHGCTRLNGYILIRAMAHYAEELKAFFVSMWEIIRPSLLKLETCPPRIWQT